MQQKRIVWRDRPKYEYCHIGFKKENNIEESETKSSNGQEIESSSDVETTEPSTVSVQSNDVMSSQSSKVYVQTAKEDILATESVKSDDTQWLHGVIGEVDEKERLVLKRLEEDLDQTLNPDEDVDDQNGDIDRQWR